MLLGYVTDPTAMDLQTWPGAVVMTLVSALTALPVTNSRRWAWLVGVLVLMAHMISAVTLCLLSPRRP